MKFPENFSAIVFSRDATTGDQIAEIIRTPDADEGIRKEAVLLLQQFVSKKSSAGLLRSVEHKFVSDFPAAAAAPARVKKVAIIVPRKRRKAKKASRK